MDAHLQPELRIGGPQDAAALTGVLAEAFDTYRDWMPDTWNPGIDLNAREEQRLATRLGEPDVWCLVAESGGQAVAYVTLTTGAERYAEDLDIDLVEYRRQLDR